MKRSLMMISLTFAVTITLLLASCQQESGAATAKEVLREKVIDKIDMEDLKTESIQVYDESDVPDKESNEKVDYNDHDVICALYEANGYTVNNIYDLGYANGRNNAVVEYYSTDGEPTECRYFYRYDWFDKYTGEFISAQYCYEGNEKISAYRIPDAKTFQILEGGPLGEVVTMEYDGDELCCTVQDHYKTMEYGDTYMFADAYDPRYCAYLDEIEYGFDEVENSIRLGFSGNTFFDVIYSIPATDIVFEDDVMIITMYNTILGENFVEPPPEDNSGAQILSVNCTGKDTIIEISTDDDLTCYSLRVVTTEWDDAVYTGKIGLQFLFDNNDALEGIYVND